jgi:Nucleotide modification associated domain 2
MKLYSYCLRYDDGAAPNPYWGICTLTICKPAIRRTASIGDWIIGTGAKNVDGHGNLSNKLVYAMLVTEKMTLEEYDQYCKQHLPEKIPDVTNHDQRRRLGDCIYDYSSGNPKQRLGVHEEENKEKDLSGEYSLLSKHFYYFGDNPIDIPKHLLEMVHQTQGHKSTANKELRFEFLKWLYNGKHSPNQLHGKPQLNVLTDEGCRAKCAKHRAEEKDIEC